MQTDFFLINFLLEYSCFRDFPGGSDSKASVYDEGDPGLIPGSGRSPGEGGNYPLDEGGCGAMAAHTAPLNKKQHWNL